MNEIILDKHIVHFNSSNCVFLGNTFTMYYDLQEPIRDAMYIKILKCEVVLNPSSTINGLPIGDTDPIFIDMKKYNRLYTSVNGRKCFEQITLNITEKFGTSVPNQYISFKTEYNSTGCSVNDTNTFVIDPVEPNLRRFDLELYDKNYKIIPKSEIKALTLILCVYSNKKKVTMY